MEIYDGNNEQTRISELRELVEGVDMDEDMFQKLSEIQLQFRVAQSYLVDLLDTTEITPEDYLDKFNIIGSDMFKSMLDLLGNERYHAIFGDEDYVNLIDRETFLGYYNDR